LFARVARDQHAEILWPAVSAGERKRFNLGAMGSFDRHRPLIAIARAIAKGKLAE
jgi:hypothetical protein